MARRFRFPRQARLVTERQFRRVYAEGRRLRQFPLRFCGVRNGDERSRLGLAVSARVGGAVVRNRWKRAIREAFRLNRHRLRCGWDIVASVSWEAEPAEVRRVEEAFLALVEALNATDAPPDEGAGGER